MSDAQGVFGPPNPEALARLQRLWKTNMTNNDYIEFLSENLWIWGSHWGDSIERACKVTNADVDTVQTHE